MSSFLNNTLRSSVQSGKSALAEVAVSRAMLSSGFQKIAKWAPLVQVNACIERPTPPADDPIPEAVQPDPAPATADPEIIVVADDRERPGITSKTTSVGKKLRLIDHKSFYGFDPSAGAASIPWNRGLDPIRFVTGKLWATHPSLDQMGKSATLYGKTVKFGSKVPVEATRLLEANNEGAMSKQFIRPIDFSRSKMNNERLKGLYSEMMLEGTYVPIFADLVEVGKILITKGSFRYEDNFAEEGPTFRKFLFGNSSDLSGQFAEGGEFNDFFNNSPFGASGLFTTISNQQASNGTYSDHSFEFSMPISSINLEHYGNISKPLSAKIDPVYNFYCKEYEGLLQNVPDGLIAEHTLPNIYTLLTEKFSKKRDSELSVNITNFLRLNPTREQRGYDGKLRTDKIQGFFVDKLNSGGEKISEESKGLSYFKKWAFTAGEMVQNGSFNLFTDSYWMYTKQVFPHEEDKLYLRLREGKSSFPMLVDIQFSTDRTAPVADAIARTKLDCFLAEYIMSGPYDGALVQRVRDTANRTQLGVEPPTREQLTTGYIESKEFIIKGSTEANTKVTADIFINTSIPDDGTSTTTGRTTYDFEEWIRSLEDMAASNPPWSIFFGDSDSIAMTHMSSFPGKSETLPLFKTYLVAKVRKLIKEEGKFRELSQVYSGKLCYNEALCYKVEKFAFVAGIDGAPELSLIARYILPNKSATDEIVFTDTQVKYDKAYFYKIQAVHLVIGNEYIYMFPQNIPGNRPGMQAMLEGADTCELHYCNFPSVRIIETPYFNSHEKEGLLATRVIDSPPVPPLVTVNPYKGVANRLLITANGGVGDFVQAPIAINQETDSLIIQKIRESQMTEMASLEKNDLTVESLQKVRFRSDDPIRRFEVYRTTSPPAAYSSFSGNLHVVLDTEGKVNSLSLIDKIIPNTKYYYTFRSIDIHDNFSNPTCIYEVEMRYDKGLSYPIIKYYNPGEGADFKIPTRPFQKFLEIRPYDEHLFLNFNSSGLDGNKNITTPEGSERRISSLFPTRRDDFKEGDQYVLGDPLLKDQAWGRTFKIRITSRQSGRKLDLNVKFDYKDLVKASDFYIKDREN